MLQLAGALLLTIALSFLSACKTPVENKPPVTFDTCCDTCHTDTMHRDTTSHSNDTTSHSFAWREYTIPENNMTGCWVFGKNDLLALNWYLYRYTGFGWNKVILHSNKGYDLDGLSGGHFFGFTYEDYWIILGSLLLHCNQDQATEYRLETIHAWQSTTDGVMNAAWGTSSHDMFFVGDTGTILHYDGASWMKYPKVTSENLHSVWGTGSNNVWASGYNTETNRTVLLHFDGSQWHQDPLSQEPTETSGGFISVWAYDSAHHPIVFASGSLLFHKRDSEPWYRDTIDVNRLGDGSYIGVSVQGNTPNDLFAVGPWGLVSHWNGRSWKRFDELYSPGNASYLTEGFSVKGNTACVVGIKGGTSWIAVGQR